MTTMTDDQKKLTRRLRRMGLKAKTARVWMSHSDDTDTGRLCVQRPNLRTQQLASVLDTLKSCVTKAAK